MVLKRAQKYKIKKPSDIRKTLKILENAGNYFAYFLYLFMNLSTLPAVSTSFTFPV